MGHSVSLPAAVIPLPVPFTARLKRSLTPPTGFIKPLVNPPQKPPDPPEPPNIPFKMGIAHEDEQQRARSIIIGVAPFIFYNRHRQYTTQSVLYVASRDACSAVHRG